MSNTIKIYEVGIEIRCYNKDGSQIGKTKDFGIKDYDLDQDKLGIIDEEIQRAIILIRDRIK